MTTNYHAKLAELRAQIDRNVLGYEHMKLMALLALLSGGHLLLRAVPGTAKTTFAKTLAQAIGGANFSRIQCTPDLTASDIAGFTYFDRAQNVWRVKRGPILITKEDKPVNIFLADEVNRATPKAKAGLLEPMQEGQVTIDDETFRLADPFIEIATMNPIEQEGTYPLAEAELDRFCMLVDMSYVSRKDELQMLSRMDIIWPVRSREEHHDTGQVGSKIVPALSIQDILQIRDSVRRMASTATPALLEYITDLVRATRPGSTRSPEDLVLMQNFDKVHGADSSELRLQIEVGASPRAEIWILRLSAAHAFVQGNEFITPDDVRAVARDVLRHRIFVTRIAAHSGFSSEQVIDKVLSRVEVIEPRR